MDTSEFTDEQIDALQALADGYNDQSVSRRDVMKLVGAGGVGALLGGGGMASATEPASAGTAQSGQLGAVGDPLDLVTEDLMDQSGNVVASANAGALEGTDLRYESVNAEKLNTDQIFAVAKDGADVDARLDAALADSTQNQTVYLEHATYTTNRTISERVCLRGPNSDSSAGISQGLRGTAVWTLSEFWSRVENFSVGPDAELVFSERRQAGFNIATTGAITITESDVNLTQIRGDGSVTFASGTSGGVIGSVSGDVSVTDNGTNQIL